MLKKICVFFIFFFSIAISPNTILAASNQVGESLAGTVIAIDESGTEEVLGEMRSYQILKIKVYRGSLKDQEIQIKHSESSMQMTVIDYEPLKVGDKINISSFDDIQGQKLFSINGKVKSNGLLLLSVIFVIVVLAVGRLWGALSLVGLASSFFVIFNMIVPMIIRGTDPVLSAILGSLIIVPTTFYISHGFNNKTHVGVFATSIGLIITGVLAAFFIDASHLTGYASEEAGFLQVERQGSIDIRGLLLAGIIIGTLGILDDVTVGQASTVQQLKKANKEMGMWDLFRNGMSVGQDHISSMVNTLVLVYSGSALPLLLLFYDDKRSFIDIIEFELIAEEIVRMLVGSIGLVLAAPLATIVAAIVFAKVKRSE